MNLNSDSGTPLPLLSLVVDPVPSTLAVVVSAISALQLELITTETFLAARELLERRPPNLLVTAIRLGEYNGLHLVLRAKAERPDIAAVVTCTARDSVLEAEAAAMGATFVQLPTSVEELRAAIVRTLFATSDEPVTPPFERRLADRRIGVAAAFEGPERRRAVDRRRGLLPTSAMPLTS